MPKINGFATTFECIDKSFRLVFGQSCKASFVAGTASRKNLSQGRNHLSGKLLHAENSIKRNKPNRTFSLTGINFRKLLALNSLLILDTGKSPIEVKIKKSLKAFDLQSSLLKLAFRLPLLFGPRQIRNLRLHLKCKGTDEASAKSPSA